jgi:hypothetical protein
MTTTNASYCPSYFGIHSLHFFTDGRFSLLVYYEAL